MEALQGLLWNVALGLSSCRKLGAPYQTRPLASIWLDGKVLGLINSDCRCTGLSVAQWDELDRTKLGAIVLLSEEWLCRATATAV